MSIFKAYDIRGIFPNEIDSYYAEKLGFAFATYLLQTHKNPTILIGRDGRIGSPELLLGFVNGVRAAKVSVDILGLCTTPSLYILTAEKKYTGGVMVTASHNPKEYNGFKFCNAKGLNIGMEQGLDMIQTIFNTTPQPKKTKRGQKVALVSHYFSEYVAFIAKKLPTPMHSSRPIIFDCSNGVAAQTIPILCRAKKLQYHGINMLIDGTFPGHDPNPTKKDNTAQIVNTISQHKDAIGIMFDGDADRIVLIDENGDMVPPAVTAQILYYTHCGKNAVLDLRLPKNVFEHITFCGGEAFESKVGMPFIKKKMLETKSAFGGETSGHFAHADIHYADDAVYNAMLVISYLEKTGERVCDIARNMSTAIVKETNISVTDTQKALNMLKADMQHILVSELDGLSFDSEDWRANIRASNTEPLLRITVESKDEKIVNNITFELKRKITTA